MDLYIVHPFLPVWRERGIDESSPHFPHKVHIVIALLLVLSFALSEGSNTHGSTFPERSWCVFYRGC